MVAVRCFLYLLLSVLFFGGCTKAGVDLDPADEPGIKDGTLYFNSAGIHYKVNIADSSEYWVANQIILSSHSNPMIIDSTTIYSGATNSLGAYSVFNAYPRWVVFWPYTHSGPIFSSVEAALGDSVVYVVSPTSYWFHSYLYCINKKTGAIHWKERIDYGDYELNFHSTPVVVGNRVITLTRDQYNKKQLTCFNADGSIHFTTPANDDLAYKIWVHKDKVFSTANSQILCYSTENGRLEWTVNMGDLLFNRTATFFDKDNLIVIKVLDSRYHVFVINTSGNILRQHVLSIPTAHPVPEFSPMAVNFDNNSLYVAYRSFSDSVSIAAYKFADFSKKWEKRYYSNTDLDVPTLMTEKYLIFPVNKSYAEIKSAFYFLDKNGKEVTGFPFSQIYVSGFNYVENNKIYQAENLFIRKSDGVHFP